MVFSKKKSTVAFKGCIRFVNFVNIRSAADSQDTYRISIKSSPENLDLHIIEALEEGESAELADGEIDVQSLPAGDISSEESRVRNHTSY